MAQWIARLTSNQAVVGSSPTGVAVLASNGGLAQSVECVVRNDEAPGSKPGFSSPIAFVCKRSHSLVVRTPLCGSGNPGSNPGVGILISARLV